MKIEPSFYTEFKSSHKKFEVCLRDMSKVYLSGCDFPSVLFVAQLVA